MKNNGVKIDTDTLKNCASKIENEVETLKGLDRDFQNVISTLSEAWQGDTASGYINEFKNTFIPEYNKAIDTFSSYATFVKDASKKYEDLENDFSNKSII